MKCPNATRNNWRGRRPNGRGLLTVDTRAAVRCNRKGLLRTVSCCASMTSRQSWFRGRRSCATASSAACIHFHVRSLMDSRSTQCRTAGRAALRFSAGTTRPVLGMLYAAFEGEARLTYALPAHLLNWAVSAALADGTLNLNGVPSLAEYQTRGHVDAWHSPERS